MIFKNNSKQIEVGEYVRTNKGNIGQIIEKRLGKFFKGKDNEIPILKNVYELDTKRWTTDEYIVKHSKNIIELIELKDYINGFQVIDFCIDKDNLNEKCGVIVLCDEYHQNNTKRIEIEDIKSILTKEQYEQNSYKIGE